jgi:hypothetical protein
MMYTYSLNDSNTVGKIKGHLVTNGQGETDRVGQQGETDRGGQQGETDRGRTINQIPSRSTGV